MSEGVSVMPLQMAASASSVPISAPLSSGEHIQERLGKADVRRAGLVADRGEKAISICGPRRLMAGSPFVAFQLKSYYAGSLQAVGDVRSIERPRTGGDERRRCTGRSCVNGLNRLSHNEIAHRSRRYDATSRPRARLRWIHLDSQNDPA